MKRNIRTTLAFMSCVLLASCNDNETEISTERFCELYSMPMGTMSFSKYAGVNEGKAHIELHTMSTLGTKEWTVTKYWANEKSVKESCLMLEK